MPAHGFALFLRALTISAATGAASVVVAAPPADRGPVDRGNSAVDRALESRARLEIRAAERAGGAASASSSMGADALSRSRGPQSSLPANGDLVIGPTPAAAAAIGLETAAGHRSAASPQAGTGRVGREFRATAAAGVARGNSSLDATTRMRTDVEGRPGLRLGWWNGTDRPRPEPAAGAVRLDRAEATVTVRGHGRDPERVLERADRLLAQRLAQIDRMRDRAVETDDADLLRQADRLELLARAQFTQRTTGEKTVGTTMRDFNTRTEPTDPNTPPQDPTTDPPSPVMNDPIGTDSNEPLPQPPVEPVQ